MIVRFSTPEDFLDEMDLDGGDVERGLVRVCFLRRPIPELGGSVSNVSLVATAQVGEDIVRLEQHLGELGWPGTTQEAFADHRVKLVAQLEERGFEVRGGELTPC